MIRRNERVNPDKTESGVSLDTPFFYVGFALTQSPIKPSIFLSSVSRSSFSSGVISKSKGRRAGGSGALPPGLSVEGISVVGRCWSVSGAVAVLRRYSGHARLRKTRFSFHARAVLGSVDPHQTDVRCSSCFGNACSGRRGRFDWAHESNHSKGATHGLMDTSTRHCRSSHRG